MAAVKPRKRCAVYCRVSSDERLDQEFNPIDAQKESGQAYVASQRSEGWIPVADDYNDQGFSGGNTKRPALKRLMAVIERGMVDIVVVYKSNRLTRNLADFSKMVEEFDTHNVSLVSVTQQFNLFLRGMRLMEIMLTPVPVDPRIRGPFDEPVFGRRIVYQAETPFANLQIAKAGKPAEMSRDDGAQLGSFSQSVTMTITVGDGIVDGISVICAGA